MKNKYQFIHKLLIIILSVIIINLRPAILGQAYTKVLLLIIFILSFITLIHDRLIYTTRAKKLLLISNSIFGVYLIIQSFIIDPSMGERTIGGIYTGFTIVLISFVLFMFIRPSDSESIIKTIIYIIFAFSLSQIITDIGIINGFENELFLRDIKIKNTRALRLYIPFTITYGTDKYTLFSSIPALPRGTGFIREAGLFQLFLNFAFFATYFVNISHKRIIRLIILLALLTTFSTAGLGIFFTSITYYLFINKKIKNVSSFLILSICILLILFLFNIYIYKWEFGLYAKFMSKSGIDRQYDMVYAISQLKKYPFFGIGFFSQNEFINPNLNIVVGLSKIGLVGMFLHILGLYFGIKYNYNKYTFVMFIPIILTSLISQPIYYTVIPVFFSYLYTSNMSKDNT